LNRQKKVGNEGKVEGQATICDRVWWGTGGR